MKSNDGYKYLEIINIIYKIFFFFFYCISSIFYYLLFF